MAHADHQGQGHFQGQDSQVQTGFDTFVMTGDMIIKTTSKLASPSTRLKPDKLPSASKHAGVCSDALPQDSEQTSLDGVTVAPPTVTSRVEVAGYPRFHDVPVKLDIPPDDISSEDERYRIDCSEDLDITNLPPPPPEFLGDFTEPCSTSLTCATVPDDGRAWQVAGLPGCSDQSENWRSSLDEAIMRLESCTALCEAQVFREVPPQQCAVEDTARLEVSSTGRANSSGNLVSAGAGVRASRSQDNWLQCGGSGVGLVNIDVDGPSASVEALHCNDSPDALLPQNKSDGAQLLHQSDDDVWYRDPSVAGNFELLPESANQTTVINSVEKPVGGDTDSNDTFVEPPACYHDNPSTEHVLLGGSASVEQSWRSSGQRLLGGGKVSPVRRPPYQNGTESAAEFNHHIPTSWNNLADSSRTQLKDADHPSACRLAKRLYHLDGFRKSDVSKHMCKKYAIILISFLLK